VLDDVLDEYVSHEAAEREYGVVLTGSLDDLSLALDSAQTTALRAERRSKRADSAQTSSAQTSSAQ
jgi:N-methylhydantoinase B